MLINEPGHHRHPSEAVWEILADLTDLNFPDTPEVKSWEEAKGFLIARQYTQRIALAIERASEELKPRMIHFGTPATSEFTAERIVQALPEEARARESVTIVIDDNTSFTDILAGIGEEMEIEEATNEHSIVLDGKRDNGGPLDYFYRVVLPVDRNNLLDPLRPIEVKYRRRTEDEVDCSADERAFDGVWVIQMAVDELYAVIKQIGQAKSKLDLLSQDIGQLVGGTYQSLDI